jgi:valyl-tRNA synthetase
MIFDTKLVTDVSSEVLTLTDVKAHLYITHTNDDDYLTALITRARKQIQNYCTIAIGSQEWVWLADFVGNVETQIPYQPVITVDDVKEKTDYGKKMSKSKGNVINPLDLTTKYGTDALRMGLIVGNPPGSDTALAEQKIKGYKNFANKLWNITRFVLSSLEAAEAAGLHMPDISTGTTSSPAATQTADTSNLTEADAAHLASWHTTLADITKDFDEYRFHLASEKIYHYVWHTFADAIIEEKKSALARGTDAEKISALMLLQTILKDALKVLHPLMPFVTEELWSMVSPKSTKPIMIHSWPLQSKQ